MTKNKKDALQASEELEQYTKKMVAHRSGYSFLILAWTVEEIRENFILPQALWKEFYGYTNFVGIYMKEISYQRERLNYYSDSSPYRALPLSDITGRLIFKMKSICNDKTFDASAEQEFGLSMGILNRIQFKKYYSIKTIEETHFNLLNSPFTFQENKRLVHLVALGNI